VFVDFSNSPILYSIKVPVTALEICYRQAGRWRRKHVKVNTGIFASFIANMATSTKLLGTISI
jgi:hypothetical protein